jgi:Skp family chaperone for outer membrane proteins
MNSTIKEMAQMAFRRMASGFWENENNHRQKKLSALKGRGADTAEAMQFFVANTKQQLNHAENKEDEELYARARQVFMTVGVEMALSALIDTEELACMNDSERQRYIFNLSAKLQEFRERFALEQQFDLPAILM